VRKVHDQVSVRDRVPEPDQLARETRRHQGMRSSQSSQELHRLFSGRPIIGLIEPDDFLCFDVVVERDSSHPQWVSLRV
jgi:hypothetical protein